MIRRVDFNSGLWHEIWQLDLQWVQGDICHFSIGRHNHHHHHQQQQQQHYHSTKSKTPLKTYNRTIVSELPNATHSLSWTWTNQTERTQEDFQNMFRMANGTFAVSVILIIIVLLLNNHHFQTTTRDLDQAFHRRGTKCLLTGSRISTLPSLYRCAGGAFISKE